MVRWYSIGALTFPASWGAIFSAFVLISLVLHFYRNKKLSDWYGNAIFIFLALWKLSVILFQFKLSIANPFNILYFHGGLKGYWLGIIGVVLYTVYNTHRNPLPRAEMIQTWAYTVMVYEMAFIIWNGEAVVYFLIQGIIAGIFIWLFKLRQATMTQLLILFTCSQGLFYSFKTELVSVSMGTYVVMCIFFSLYPIQEAKK